MNWRAKFCEHCAAGLPAYPVANENKFHQSQATPDKKPCTAPSEADYIAALEKVAEAGRTTTANATCGCSVCEPMNLALRELDALGGKK